MKAILFSDLHAHNWQEFSTLIKWDGAYLNSRLVDALKVLKAIRTYVQTAKIDYVIFAGDLFHRRKLIDASVFNPVIKAVWRLAKVVKEVYILTGNHDLNMRPIQGEYTSEHSLYALSGKRNVSIVDTPTVVLDHIGLVPYNVDWETTIESVRKVEKKSKAFIMHAGIANAIVGSLEYRPLEPIRLEDLPSVPIYAGHYHTPQRIKNLTYIGAPLEMVRGESHGGRGFMELDLNTYNAQWVPYACPEFIEAKDTDSTLVFDNIQNGFVDLLITEADTDIKKAVNDYMESGARAVNVVMAIPPKTNKTRLKLEHKRGGVLPTITELVEQYVKQTDTKLDKSDLLGLGNKLLQQALGAVCD